METKNVGSSEFEAIIRSMGTPLRTPWNNGEFHLIDELSRTADIVVRNGLIIEIHVGARLMRDLC